MIDLPSLNASTVADHVGERRQLSRAGSHLLRSACAAAIVGCLYPVITLGQGREIPFVGRTMGDFYVVRSAMNIFRINTSKLCPEPDRIVIELVEKPETIKTDAEGKYIDGCFAERWTMEGCGISKSYIVFMKFNSKGGMRYGTAPNQLPFCVP